MRSRRSATSLLLLAAVTACGDEPAPRDTAPTPEPPPAALLGCYALRPATASPATPAVARLAAGVALEAEPAAGYELDWHETPDERRRARDRVGVVRRAALLDARGAVVHRAGDGERNHPVWWVDRGADSVHVVLLAALGTTEVVLAAGTGQRARDTLAGRAFDSTAYGPPFSTPRGPVVAVRRPCAPPARRPAAAPR